MPDFLNMVYAGEMQNVLEHLIPSRTHLGKRVTSPAEDFRVETESLRGAVVFVPRKHILRNNANVHKNRGSITRPHAHFRFEKTTIIG